MTEALLDQEVFLGHLALEGTREKKETKVTKSTLGGEREVSPPSRELTLAEQAPGPVLTMLMGTYIKFSLKRESWSLPMSY